MIGSIFVILLIFSVIWLLIWLWFFQAGKKPTENFYKLGVKAFDSGDFNDAKKFLTQALHFRMNLDALFKLGVACSKLGDYDEAEAHFRKVLKSSPKNADAAANLALALKNQGKYDEALKLYTEIFNKNPKNPDAALDIANLYFDQGDYIKAMESLEDAKKSFPSDIKVMLSVVKCKSKLSNIENEDECKQIMDEYLALASKGTVPSGFHIDIAKACAVCGDIDKALEYSQKAIASNAEDVQAYQLLGLIQLVNMDFEGAKSNLSLALNIQPKNKETHNIFSYVLCQQVSSCTLSKCRENYYKLIKKHLK